MKQLMEASTVDDFSLIDIIKPDPERFINQLSALINFVKFKLDRVKTWNELASRSVQLREECAQLNAEQESLEREIEECKVAKDRDQEEMEAIRVENEELEAEIHSRNKKQSQERVVQRSSRSSTRKYTERSRA